jgi:nicotinamidase/pyrazinamidase
VVWTALGARAAGVETIVVEDACQGIDLEGSLASAWQAMQAAVARAALRG